jgi:hypothetical protein
MSVCDRAPAHRMRAVRQRCAVQVARGLIVGGVCAIYWRALSTGRYVACCILPTRTACVAII